MNKLQMKVLMEESVEALLRNVQNLTDAQVKMETEEWMFAEREQMMEKRDEMLDMWERFLKEREMVLEKRNVLLEKRDKMVEEITNLFFLRVEMAENRVFH